MIEIEAEIAERSKEAVWSCALSSFAAQQPEHDRQKRGRLTWRELAGTAR